MDAWRLMTGALLLQGMPNLVNHGDDLIQGDNGVPPYPTGPPLA